MCGLEITHLNITEAIDRGGDIGGAEGAQAPPLLY